MVQDEKKFCCNFCYNIFSAVSSMLDRISSNRISRHPRMELSLLMPPNDLTLTVKRQFSNWWDTCSVNYEWRDFTPQWNTRIQSAIQFRFFNFTEYWARDVKSEGLQSHCSPRIYLCLMQGRINFHARKYIYHNKIIPFSMRL